ncbi:MAG TPA: hypothetical protein VLB80_02460 [Candidatus Babeliales bacterium]|nr:hypothetical protein [Candidatus Babeliales bacterium]
MGMSIGIIDDKPKKKWGHLSAKGEIQINDFRETLYIPLGWWSLDDYKKQWHEGIERLSYYDRTCFIVAVNNPQKRRFIEWWVLYKIDDKVYVQNQIIISDIYTERIGDKPFTLKTCYDFIPERGEPYDEDGNKISEWVVDLVKSDEKINLTDRIRVI